MTKPMRKLATGLSVLLLGFTGGVGGTLVASNYLAPTNSQSLMNTTPQASGEQAANLTKTSTTEAVRTIQEAVVSVVTYKSQTDQLSDIYSRLFGNATDSAGEEDFTVYSEGSGVIYKKDGNTAYVVTNNHVVEGGEKLEIILSDGSRLEAELVGADTYSDLAVVKISGESIQTVGQFTDSSSLTLGEPAIAIGSPLGSEYANSVTEGIVSGLSRTVTSTNDYGETISTNAIQTDAAINQGNSGGPLINIKGQIIGINSSKITSSRTNVSVEGMGFAIPSNDVMAIIKQLEENGQVIRPAIGISMADLNEVPINVLNDLKIPEDLKSGILVGDVQDNMPAAGQLQEYDIITAINGEAVKSTSDLQSILYRHQVGDTMTLTIYRDQKEQTVELTLSKTNQDLTSTR